MLTFTRSALYTDMGELVSGGKKRSAPITVLLMQDFANFLQSRFDLMLVAAIVRMVVFPPCQLVRHVLLRSHGSRPIMSVPIPLMIAPTFHQGGRRIP